MDCVILFRTVSSGRLDFIADADGDIAVFPNVDAAIEFAEASDLFNSAQANYQIVELNEL